MISERLHFSRFSIGFQQDFREVVFQQGSSRSSVGFQGGCISVEARHAFSRSSEGVLYFNRDTIISIGCQRCCISVGFRKRLQYNVLLNTQSNLMSNIIQSIFKP